MSCNCAMYWFEKARRAALLPAKLAHLRCAAPGPPSLDARQLDDMVRSSPGLRPRQSPPLLSARPLQECVLSAASDCPANCSCSWRPAHNTTLVSCVAAGLTASPALRGELLKADHLILDLSGNLLTALPAPDSLPSILDVRPYSQLPFH